MGAIRRGSSEAGSLVKRQWMELSTDIIDPDLPRSFFLEKCDSYLRYESPSGAFVGVFLLCNIIILKCILVFIMGVRIRDHVDAKFASLDRTDDAHCEVMIETPEISDLLRDVSYAAAAEASVNMVSIITA